jgi:hypothetical protein
MSTSWACGRRTPCTASSAATPSAPPSAMTVHDFSGRGDSAATAKAWGGFLEKVYA